MEMRVSDLKREKLFRKILTNKKRKVYMKEYTFVDIIPVDMTAKQLRLSQLR